MSHAISHEEFTKVREEIKYLVQSELKSLTSWRECDLEYLTIANVWKNMEQRMKDMMAHQEVDHQEGRDLEQELSNFAVYEGKKILMAFFLQYNEKSLPYDHYIDDVVIVKEVMKIVKEYEGICYEDGKLLPGARRRRDYAAVVAELREDDEEFQKCTGMSQDQFDMFIEDSVAQLDDVKHGDPTLPGDFSLLVTLKHLVLGHSIKKIHMDYLPLDYWTTQLLVTRTLRYILEQYNLIEIESAQDEGDNFNYKYKIPNCMGVIGCKHVKIEKPRFFPEDYLNYRNSYSLVLKVECDSQGEFIYFTIGEDLRLEDDLPQPKRLPRSNTEFPYYWIGDGSFPLTEHIMTPYRGTNLTEQQQNYNMRLTLALNAMERSFAEIVNRFKIMQGKVKAQPIQGNSSNMRDANLIIRAVLGLHTFIRQTSNRSTPRVSSKMPTNSAIFDEKRNAQQPTGDSLQLRDTLKDYFWESR